MLHMCIYTYIHICMYRMIICVNMYKCVYNMCVYTYIYIYIYMFVYIYLYIYIHTHT